MPLALDYRPKSLDDVIGNEPILKSISALLAREQKAIPHTWMLTGPSGCGKTTIGRIIATELGCDEADYLEVDSADFRGIDMVRELRKKMQYKPRKGAVSVYLLDECHKLSNDAQNALLKALEEPPPHVFFILCTTNPEKLIKTIHTRCQKFEVQLIEPGPMKDFLYEIAEQEEKKIPGRVLKQIAIDSLGSPRAALQILESIIDLDEADMEEAAAQSASRTNQTIDLCKALINKGGWKEVCTILDGLKGEEPESVRRSVMGYAAAVMKKGDLKRASRPYLVLSAFADRNTYDIGWHSILLACYEALSE